MAVVLAGWSWRRARNGRMVAAAAGMTCGGTGPMNLRAHHQVRHVRDLPLYRRPLAIQMQHRAGDCWKNA
jgi:hypothetical protein